MPTGGPDLTIDHGHLVPLYRRLRRIGRDLHSALLKRLPRATVMEGAAALGLLEGETVVLPTDVAGDVLVDHCLYDRPVAGQTVIARHLEAAHPAAGSDEALVLAGMGLARFGVFRITAVERGVGLHVVDGRDARVVERDRAAGRAADRRAETEH